MITIMIVEDNSSLNRLYSKILQSEQTAILRALNCHEARQLLEDSKPDIIVLDMNLPDGNGIDVIDHVHYRYGQHSVGFVVLSGSAQSLAEARHNGIEHILQKPVATMTLRDSVYATLKTKSQ